MTTHRLNFHAAAPEAAQAVLDLSRYGLQGSSLDENLLNIVQLRASQMNRCGFCTVLHINDARDAGETNERLDTVAVWREVPYFNERERIALELAEVLTDRVHLDVDDDLYARAASEFGDRGFADLVMAIATINVWNRINGAFHTPPNQHFRTRALTS